MINDGTLPDFHTLQRWAGMISTEAERNHATATYLAEIVKEKPGFDQADVRLRAARHRDVLGDEFDKLAAFLDWCAGRANKLYTLGVADPIARHQSEQGARR